MLGAIDGVKSIDQHKQEAQHCLLVFDYEIHVSGFSFYRNALPNQERHLSRFKSFDWKWIHLLFQYFESWLIWTESEALNVVQETTSARFLQNIILILTSCMHITRILTWLINLFISFIIALTYICIIVDFNCWRLLIHDYELLSVLWKWKLCLILGEVLRGLIKGIVALAARDLLVLQVLYCWSQSHRRRECWCPDEAPSTSIQELSLNLAFFLFLLFLYMPREGLILWCGDVSCL